MWKIPLFERDVSVSMFVGFYSNNFSLYFLTTFHYLINIYNFGGRASGARGGLSPKKAGDAQGLMYWLRLHEAERDAGMVHINVRSHALPLQVPEAP